MSDTVKLTPNALTPDQCAEIIAQAEAGVNHEQFTFDILKADTQTQDRFMTKEELDFRSEERTASPWPRHPALQSTDAMQTRPGVSKR